MSCDVEPEVRMLLAGRHEPPDALGEHLGTAPGSEPSPAPWSSRSTSSWESPESVVMWWISEAV